MLGVNVIVVQAGFVWVGISIEGVLVGVVRVDVDNMERRRIIGLGIGLGRTEGAVAVAIGVRGYYVVVVGSGNVPVSERLTLVVD